MPARHLYCSPIPTHDHDRQLRSQLLNPNRCGLCRSIEGGEDSVWAGPWSVPAGEPSERLIALISE